MADHYFSAQPLTPDERYERDVTIDGTEYSILASPGVFSPGRLDKGTRVLLKYAPEPPDEGLLVDLGCGWGPLSLALATACPEARVLAVDVNERARELTRLNAERAGLTNIEVCGPQEGLEIARETGVRGLWSNPPVRIGKQHMRDLLMDWLSLVTGESILVIAKNLGADSHAAFLADTFEVARLGSSGGFRVLSVRPRES
ncbi:MAG: methyltransferase [Flaviflexus sp.]|nr:methyltransferase [Flaviflexus sp.]